MHAFEFFNGLSQILAALDMQHQMSTVMKMKVYNVQTNWLNQKHVADSLNIDLFTKHFRKNELWRSKIEEDGRFLQMLRLEFMIQDKKHKHQHKQN